MKRFHFLFGYLSLMPLATAFAPVRTIHTQVPQSVIRHAMTMNAEWSQIKIKKNEKDGEGLRLMEIETTPDVCSLYKLPGQYVQIRAAADAKPGFYAICNAPKSSSSSFSFLIKDVENNSFLTNAKEGETLEMSIPMGKGFQTQEYFEKYKFDYATTQVIMMACGSGIAPIAAAIESETLGLMKKNYNALYERKGLLYIGARTEAHLPLQHKYKDWSELGMTIIPVLSQPSSDWTGRTGYIQDVLKKDKISIPKNSGALLCGPRGMTDAARELFLEAGVFEGRILLNF